MSKLTRRDYLKQMAAAGAIVSASRLLSPSSSLAAVDQGPVPQTVTKPTFLFTPTTPTPPGATNLTLIFGGIMGISNTKNGVAQVGFQKGMGKHKLEIKVYRINNTGYHQIPVPNPASVKIMELAIPDEPANVNFFHKATFDRDITKDDAKDFGWVLDFEDSLLYPGGVAWRRRKKFRPVLKLSQGTFYTQKLTRCKFDLIEANNVNNPLLASLNELPRFVGAAVDIPAQKKAVFKFDGAVAADLPYVAGEGYEIRFMNECFEPGGSHCKWNEPSHTHETKRNDFYMHYLMFTHSAKKCGVIVQPQCPPPLVEATDEAPCMATGFGRKTEFPAES